ncbi:MAG TPA: hypothetical protein VHG92_07015 [Afifellaceae bacterium]|nr:hypothetical protein [Afifellaceae bacterium]
MDDFEFATSAELFIGQGKNKKRYPVGYRRFGTAAEAIRFTMEELPAAFLAGTILEVCEERFDNLQIRLLYDRADYPLARCRKS